MHTVKGLLDYIGMNRLYWNNKKKETECGLLLTSDFHIRKCNPRPVIV